MADYRLRGPTDAWQQSLRIDNGSLCRQAAAGRGPTDGAQAGHASEWDPRMLLRRAQAVQQALEMARERTPQAIVRATGLDDLPRLANAVITGMLEMALVVAATSALGGVAGAAIGALFGGVGAVPGAAVGAQLGFDAGMALMAWLGLALIATEVVRGLGEVTQRLRQGVVTAWDAEDAADRQQQIARAGQTLADAMGQLMLVVLMAIVARLAASQAITATGRATGSAGELFAALRRSRLGGGFAAWVESHADDLLRNPRLRAHAETSGSSAQGSLASTPSALKAQVAKPGPPAPSTPSPAAPLPRPTAGPRDAFIVDADGVPIGAKPGLAPPTGLAPEALTRTGWPDLPATQAPNFIAAEPVTLKPGTKLYRVIDDQANPAGGYWSETLPASRADWRSSLAVKNGWNSNGQYVEYTVPDGPGLNVWRGPAAPQQYIGADYHLPGGGTQVWMPPNTVTPSASLPTGW